MGRGMYALGSRPNKIATNARIGPPKSLKDLEGWDTNKHQIAVGMNSPKPVFNGSRVRPPYHSKHNNAPPQQQQQQLSPQHDEFVRYLHDAWQRVNHEMDVNAKNQREGGPVVYKEKNPNPRLSDFKAIDLEDFWGKCYLQRVTGSSS